MIYKAYLKQDGEGCDYTIGCAQTVINIEAENFEEAKQKLFEKIEGCYIDDQKLESCKLFEINNIFVCDLKDWYKKIDESKNKANELKKEDLERKEFERLKAKFG